MRAEALRILVVGRNFAPGSPFLERLCRNGCACAIAHSLEEARAAVRAQEFDLVLSDIGLPDGSAVPLLALLEGTPATLYFCVSVHDGCWWLPALDRGRQTWGDAALRPPDFAHALETLLRTDPLPSGASAPNVMEMPAPPAVERAKPQRAAAEPGTQARKASP